MSGCPGSGGGVNTPLPGVCTQASVTGFDLEVPSGLGSEKGTPWTEGSWGWGYGAGGVAGEELRMPLPEAWLLGLVQGAWGLEGSSGPPESQGGVRWPRG